ncbi:hypothetical protein QGM71_01385 [Virgibacillus sp. C22-A2]|uniref:Uncharacterized protein n=1 Tax=Virgibacillus tibetensis TaxID=3042313 RepID=A0ABU6KB60_9BACI|nr:hypothetical protein [Virgibacillus sp. C22-A2]
MKVLIDGVHVGDYVHVNHFKEFKGYVVDREMPTIKVLVTDTLRGKTKPFELVDYIHAKVITRSDEELQEIESVLNDPIEIPKYSYKKLFYLPGLTFAGICLFTGNIIGLGYAGLYLVFMYGVMDAPKSVKDDCRKGCQ